MTPHYNPEENSLRTQYAIQYLTELIQPEADGSSIWWHLVTDEILHSSIVSLRHAMTALSGKLIHHDDSVLLVNTHLRIMTKALNNRDLMVAVDELTDTFTQKTLPAYTVTYDFVDKDNTTLLFNAFERVLFFLFCYQDDVINRLYVDVSH